MHLSMGNACSVSTGRLLLAPWQHKMPFRCNQHWGQDFSHRHLQSYYRSVFLITDVPCVLCLLCYHISQAFTRALANVFGVKATARGGSSSGNTSLVLQSTSSTALLSEDDGVRLKRLRDLLSAEVAVELTAAAVAGGHAAGSGQKKRSRLVE